MVERAGCSGGVAVDELSIEPSNPSIDNLPVVLCQYHQDVYHRAESCPGCHDFHEDSRIPFQCLKHYTSDACANQCMVNADTYMGETAKTLLSTVDSSAWKSIPLLYQIIMRSCAML
jgi:hypothetical protein